MLDFILEDANIPFTIALSLVLAIGILEIIMTVLGPGLSAVIDAAMPNLGGGAELDADIDIDAGGVSAGDLDTGAFDADADFNADFDTDANIDADASVAPADAPHAVTPDANTPGAILRILSWVGVGKVPILVVAIVFLMTFAGTGLAVQAILKSFINHMAPAALACIPALLLAFPVTRHATSAIAKVIPKETTEAVSTRSFIGMVAKITIGTARTGHPAEAKLVDRFGRTHYFMVEPDLEDDTFETGSEVLLVRQDGPRFRVIQNTSEAMVN